MVSFFSMLISNTVIEIGFWDEIHGLKQSINLVSLS